MKDPAVLIYFDKWISSTNGMKAQFRAWYFDLLICQYDKGYVPFDFDELAGICRVRPSEYEDFKQMLKQVLEQKFTQNEDGNYINAVAMEVIRKREAFKDKRSKSGNIGVVIKLFYTLNGIKNVDFAKLKAYLYELDEDTLNTFKDKQMLKQMLKQNDKLYINVNEDVNGNVLETKNNKLYYDFEFLNLIKPNIKISIKEYETLCNDFTEEIANKAIIHFSNWKIEKGKDSKSDYLTIRRWVIDAVTKQGQPTTIYQKGGISQREPTHGGQTLTELNKLNNLI